MMQTIMEKELGKSKNVIVSRYKPLYVEGEKRAAYRIETIFKSPEMEILSYTFKKGVMVTLSHRKNADGTFRPAPGEVVSHFVAKGKVRYSSSHGDVILSAGENIVFHESLIDFKLIVLERATIYVSQTPDVNSAPRQDKLIAEKIEDINARDHYTKTHCAEVAS